jgi:hypothetical protein
MTRQLLNKNNMKPILHLNSTPRPNDSSGSSSPSPNTAAIPAPVLGLGRDEIQPVAKADLGVCHERRAYDLGKMPPTDTCAEVEPRLIDQAALAGQPDGVLETLTSPIASTAPVRTEAHQGNGMALYEAARRDLAEARDVSEVKDIHDRMVGLAEYAREAKKTELIESAVDIRLRAARRAGEMLIEMKARGQRDDGKGNRNPTLKSRAATPKLADLDISKSQSSRWQGLALLSQEEFERTVEQRTRKALSSIDRTAPTPNTSACINDNPLRDLQKVVQAVESLCSVASPQKVVAAESAGSKHIKNADLARAIEFLEELQSALETRVGTVGQLVLELHTPDATQ